MIKAVILTILVVTALSNGPAGACDPNNAVTDDRCDLGDRVSGRMPAETWGDLAARRQVEVERQYAMPDADQGEGRRRHKGW